MPKDLNVNMDFLGHGGIVQGDIASVLANSGRIDPGYFRPYLIFNEKTKNWGAFVTVYTGGPRDSLQSYKRVPIQANTGTLRRDEWKQLDEAILKIQDFRLGGIQDLIDNGLTYTLGNAMGSTVLEYHDVSDAFEAELTMDGVTRGKGDRPVYGTNYLPIPIIHVDYEINSRALAASRNLGQPLDTTSVERAARKVNERLEAMLFTNVTYKYGGGTIYSYLNHPKRNQVTLTASWDDSSTTGAVIVNDVATGLKQASIDARHYGGPWMLYVPTSYETKLDLDYDSTTPGTTIRERILKIDGIKGIKVIDTLPTDNVLFVRMTSDVVRLVQGMGIQTIEWQTEGKFLNKYKVMTIQVPQVRADQDGHCGIVHGSV